MVDKKCKRCYDSERRKKIKNGDWEFNAPMPDTLTDVQHQVLVGGLIGDFHLYNYDHHKTNGISVGRAIKDLRYLEYQYSLFKDFCSDTIHIEDTFDKRTQKTYTSCRFRTRCAPVFVPYRTKWYPEGIKIVPEDLELTPLICAIWFCDDGSAVREGDSLQLSLYTDGFQKKEVEFLSELLQNKFGDGFVVQLKSDEKFYIRMRKEAGFNFIDYITPVFPESMKRKSDKWKGLI